MHAFLGEEGCGWASTNKWETQNESGGRSLRRRFAGDLKKRSYST
jgi:hypothetical protein